MATVLRAVLPILAIILTASLPQGAGADAASPLDTMFPGAKALSSTNWNMDKGIVKPWRAMLARWADGALCDSDTCTTKGWAEMVAQVKAAGDLGAEIKTANSLINNSAQHPYIEDIANWKQTEYWATPYEFLKKSGDTEDFAIAKYFLLREAGVPAKDMEIVAVRLKALGGIGHAILAVAIDDSRVLVLDNRTPQALDAKLVAGEFQPAMGVNEESWRVYLPK